MYLKWTIPIVDNRCGNHYRNGVCKGVKISGNTVTLVGSDAQGVISWTCWIYHTR